MRVHQNGARATLLGATQMFKKVIIALVATLALISSVNSGANAQGGCEESTASAYARPRC